MIYTVNIQIPILQKDNINTTYLKSNDINTDFSIIDIKQFTFEIQNHCAILYNAIMQVKTKNGNKLQNIDFPLDVHIPKIKSVSILPGDILTLQVPSTLILYLYQTNQLQNMDLNNTISVCDFPSTPITKTYQKEQEKPVQKEPIVIDLFNMKRTITMKNKRISL